MRISHYLKKTTEAKDGAVLTWYVVGPDSITRRRATYNVYMKWADHPWAEYLGTNGVDFVDDWSMESWHEPDPEYDPPGTEGRWSSDGRNVGWDGLRSLLGDPRRKHWHGSKAAARNQLRGRMRARMLRLENELAQLREQFKNEFGGK